jgi:hypothetical protein
MQTLAVWLLVGRWVSNRPQRQESCFTYINTVFGTISGSVTVAYRGILLGGGSTNSVGDKGQRERRSGGGSPLVRGSAQFANDWNTLSFSVVTDVFSTELEIRFSFLKTSECRGRGVVEPPNPPPPPLVRHWSVISKKSLLQFRTEDDEINSLPACTKWVSLYWTIQLCGHTNLLECQECF